MPETLSLFPMPPHPEHKGRVPKPGDDRALTPEQVQGLVNRARELQFEIEVKSGKPRKQPNWADGSLRNVDGSMGRPDQD